MAQSIAVGVTERGRTNHWNHPPTLMELARQAGLNECPLKREFRQVFGKTVFSYLHDYRLEQARQLLDMEDMTTAQVSRMVGFANRGYFAAVFREKFGINLKTIGSNEKFCLAIKIPFTFVLTKNLPQNSVE